MRTSRRLQQKNQGTPRSFGEGLSALGTAIAGRVTKGTNQGGRDRAASRNSMLRWPEWVIDPAQVANLPAAAKQSILR